MMVMNTLLTYHSWRGLKLAGARNSKEEREFTEHTEKHYQDFCALRDAIFANKPPVAQVRQSRAKRLKCRVRRGQPKKATVPACPVAD